MSPCTAAMRFTIGIGWLLLGAPVLTAPRPAVKDMRAAGLLTGQSLPQFARVTPAYCREAGVVGCVLAVSLHAKFPCV